MFVTIDNTTTSSICATLTLSKVLVFWVLARLSIFRHNGCMSYSVGTHVTFKKKEATEIFRASTQYAVGTKIRFLNWLENAAVLDLSIA